MDEVVPKLWIGNLPSALDTEGLKAKKIFSVLTAMRGKITINATLNKRQINIDDSADEDVLVHFLPSISFIQTELDKGRGVLVHCQAGISRSATIVAAYLMYTHKVDVATALDMIRKVRPAVEPNEGFLHQLEVFHDASCKFTRRDKSIRMFYMERTTEEIMNGDGTLPTHNMFAKRPCSPNDSSPNTPVIAPCRRIRCKMCRQELASRENMLDHGQLGPPTPALPSLTPASSRRPSNSNDPSIQRGCSSRRPSIRLNVSISRRPSNANANTQPPRPVRNSSSLEGRPAIPLALGGRSLLESFSMSALEIDDDEDKKEAADNTSLGPLSRKILSDDTIPCSSSPVSMDNVGRDLSDALDGIASAPVGAAEPEPDPSQVSSSASEVRDGEEKLDVESCQPQAQPPNPGPQYASPADLAAQLYSSPKLAGLRTSSSLTMTSISGSPSKQTLSPPILMNPKCSGYFLEPMKWMEPLLEQGELAGKIVCPNSRCGVKLGNYDWAGMRCSCKEWVIPGFCIHRSKVDEITV